MPLLAKNISAVQQACSVSAVAVLLCDKEDLLHLVSFFFLPAPIELRV